MNTYQAFWNSSTDIFWFTEGLFEDELEDFNFELTPHHILSKVTELESMHTYIKLHQLLCNKSLKFILDSASREDKRFSEQNGLSESEENFIVKSGLRDV